MSGGILMNKFTTCIAAVAALIATPALAADMAVKAPPPAPAPTYSWTGFYAGLNAGDGWGSNTIDNSFTPGACTGPGANPSGCALVFPFLITPLPGQFDIHSDGFIGGGQVGYNYQSGAFVWGIETDFQGANIKGNASTTGSLLVPPPFVAGSLVTTAATGSERIDWFGTLRGRLGWVPTPPLLVYATGGLAYAHVQTGAAFSLQTFDPGAGQTGSGSTALFQSETRTGWTVGGGLEWMIAPQWSVRGEYLYYDLGTVTLNQTLGLVGQGLSAGSFIGVNTNQPYTIGATSPGLA
jgi:outer membrane immunogenic protein